MGSGRGNAPARQMRAPSGAWLYSTVCESCLGGSRQVGRPGFNDWVVWRWIVAAC